MSTYQLMLIHQGLDILWLTGTTVHTHKKKLKY